MKLPDLLGRAIHSSTGLFAFLALLLTGCGTCPPSGCLKTAPINVENSNYVLSPALRMGVEMSDSKQVPSEPHTGQALEFGVAHTSGSGTQYISANEQVVLNHRPVAGPNTSRERIWSLLCRLVISLA